MPQISVSTDYWPSSVKLVSSLFGFMSYFHFPCKLRHPPDRALICLIHFCWLDPESLPGFQIPIGTHLTTVGNSENKKGQNERR